MAAAAGDEQIQDVLADRLFEINPLLFKTVWELLAQRAHSKDELSKYDHTPGSLPDALAALEKDHKFLLEGGVFTKDVIEAWIEYKMENEVDPLRLRPHPYEFHLYYDN